MIFLAILMEKDKNYTIQSLINITNNTFFLSYFYIVVHNNIVIEPIKNPKRMKRINAE
jgi:hypothetical protein